ncbi:peptide chain release factor N(5)-glutamine methyltransferase [Donghicola sp. C2-DW-16]|uniref:Release factor glutamine methyltransferase n=1 Tax=Donghicola mangrovi TaxID=2729614 RepID=A0ABX2PCY6_9RHOB|nr:peptide chain release factor N(5)-glutamine methyltransferase [Donghicola mangrovi]NVO26887.1 peptide chain release factor N(5)-glutamine methyltransferase [Donghicola mangrovi]
MTLQQALIAAIQRLRDAGVPDPAVDARRLLAHSVGEDAGRLILMMHDALPDNAAEAFDTLITRRCAREPVSHLTGGRDFYGRRFTVTRYTLDPRPETETLVGLALEAPFAHLLDLGTGTGCIALTLLAEMPDAQGVAADLSPAALAVAQGNAEALEVADRCAFIQSDWFSAVNGDFDLIVSNPPYIDAAEMPDLSPEVRLHEPHLALTPGEDGTAPYGAIAAGAMTHLTPNGRLLVEIGYRQGPAVAGIFADSGLTQVSIHKDMNGHDRVVSAIKPSI